MALAVATASVGLFAGPAHADEPVTLETLERRLEERDAVIESLVRRVEELESRLGAASVAPSAAVPAANPAHATAAPSAAPSTSSPPVSAAGDSRPTEAAAPTATSQAAPEPSASEQAQTAAAAAAEPGRVAPDPFAAERALERSLVDSGALLLQPGFFDVAPFVGYSRTETTAAGLVVDADGFPDFGQSQVRRNVVDLGANLRGGLPFESQLEVGIPFRYVDRTIVNSSGFQPLVSDSGSNFTFGDMTVGLAKTLLREDQGFVDVIGRVTGRLPTGDDVVNDVVTGGGFAGVSGGLTVTRREDPLVFVGSAGYEELFESDNVDPGSEISWSLTTFLAVTPNTSLKFGVNQAFLGKTEINGRVVDGSDGVATSLVLGGSAVLTPRALLDVSVAAGLTDAASDFSIFATLPLRFDFPLLAD